MAHNNDQHLDDLCEEALIANLLPLFHYCLNLLPDPLLSGWIRRISLSDLLLAEESVDKLRDKLRLEQLFEFPRRVRAGKRQRHECELKHVVFCLVARL